MHGIPGIELFTASALSLDYFIPRPPMPIYERYASNDPPVFAPFDFHVLRPSFVNYRCEPTLSRVVLQHESDWASKGFLKQHCFPS